MKIHSKIKVELGKNSYDIVIGNDLISSSGNSLQKILPAKSKVFVISDKNTSKYSAKLKKSLSEQGFQTHELILPTGEKTKSFANLEKIFNSIFPHRPERNSTLLALGGGVIGDITGFAASALLRGVNFVQFPTSLLAMVDSSVGGKTGINVKFGKNLVGSFYQPKLVLADIDLLKTLPKRELLAGYAEIVKYGLINDRKFFEFLEAQKDFSEIAKMIEVSCKSKAEIVSADEKESGKRALLNLGHTFGHALETIGEYDGTLLHGEAVAIGMIQAFRFSEYLGLCKKGCADRVEKHFKSKKMKTKLSETGLNLNVNKILRLMYQDKKVSSGKLTFILAEDIGKAFIKKDVDESALKEFLKIDLAR